LHLSFSPKSFQALRYIPSSVAVAFMGLPFGIIHHSISLPVWIPERIFGLRAKKKIKVRPQKALSLNTFFYARRQHLVRYFRMCSGKSFHALRYIPSSVAATFMGLPFGITHHSIRFPTWMPEGISGLRAKRIQRQPPKGFVFAYFFHVRNHITFCPVILR